jgi:hypothetical protein
MNGWKNWETWNVSLWLNNDEATYLAARDYAARTAKANYKGLISWLGLSEADTPDGAPYLSSALDYKALNGMVRELAA